MASNVYVQMGLLKLHLEHVENNVHQIKYNYHLVNVYVEMDKNKMDMESVLIFVILALIILMGNARILVVKDKFGQDTTAYARMVLRDWPQMCVHLLVELTNKELKIFANVSQDIKNLG